MAARRTRDERSPRLSRRALLRLAGGAGGAALLAACGAEGASPVSTPLPTSAPGGGATPTAARAAATAAASRPPAATAAAVGAPGEIRILNTGAKLPTEKATLRWISSGPGPKGIFFEQFFKAYQQAHPNITVQFEQLGWNEIGKVVPLGVQNGNAHDVFQVPLNVPGPQAVKEGWVAPLDDLIPNFAEWQGAFPPGAFVNGITTFNGKTYTIPLSSNQRYGTLTLYNVEYARKADVDPGAKPLTWDEFRAAAKKITEQGQGQYFGLLLEGKQTNRFSAWVGALGEMAGAAGGEINWKTGRYNYTSDQYLAAIDLLLALKADNSIFPGSLSLDANEARARMPQGAAGMMLQGPWNIPQWRQEAPGFKFGVGSQPIPNTGTPMPLGYGPGGANHFWLYTKSPQGAIAGDIFHHLGAEQIQTVWATITGGVADPPIRPQALAAVDLGPLERKTAELFKEQLRLHPSPLVRNPDVAQVELELKPLKPNAGEVIQGIFTGQLRDPKAAMQDLRDRAEKELDRAIKAAADKGAKVSRDDWVFPNWEPTRDYTEADYKS